MLHRRQERADAPPGEAFRVLHVERQLGIEVGNEKVQAVLPLEVAEALEVGCAVARRIGHDERTVHDPIHVDPRLQRVVGKAENARPQLAVLFQAARNRDAGTGIVNRVDAAEADV